MMLALGVGACTAMFSVLQGVILTNLPYPGGDRVVSVGTENVREGGTSAGLTAAEAERMARSDQSAFEAFGYFVWDGLTAIATDQTRELRIARVSDGFFPALGVAPLHGRVFGRQSSGAADELILSHTEWQRLTGADPSAVGNPIETVEHGRMRLIGVMPPEFSYPSSRIGGWRALPSSELGSDTPAYWNGRYIEAVGRIAESTARTVALDRAQAVIDGVRESYGAADAGWRVTATPLIDGVVGDSGPVLWAAFGVAVLILLIACANVAILLDAHQIQRQREQAIEQALGASRTRLYRILLIELGILGIGGAVVGFLFAGLALEMLLALAEGSVPRAAEIGIDGRVLAFALSIALATPLLAAALGSLRLRGQPIDALGGGGKGAAAMNSSRTRLLPVLGVALSTMALFAAAALVASLSRIKDLDAGFHHQNINVLQLGRQGSAEEWTSFAERMQEDLRGIPGVTDVALTTTAPLSGLGTFRTELTATGQEMSEPLRVRIRRISPAYFDLLDIPIVTGRNFSGEDQADSERVAIVNRDLATRLFGSQSALGKMVAFSLDDGEPIRRRIVGVSEDIRNEGLRTPISPEVLVPFEQEPWIAMSFLVRTGAPLPGIAQQMRDVLSGIDPLEGISHEYTMEEAVALQLRPARFFARAVSGFALCALLLAAMGVYAVATQHQQQRRAELGLRLAIGAPRGRLAWQSINRSLGSGAIGVTAGALAGWGVLQLLQAQLFEFGGRYAPWFLLVAAAILGTVVIAAIPPAVRAARTDPMIALRGGD
jgi:putative ABC transport system permease protein